MGAKKVAEKSAETEVQPTIFVPQIRRDVVKLTVVGDSPLVVHKWSEKAKRQMFLKQTTGVAPKKEKKVPEDDFKASMYTLPSGKYAFPGVAFKAAAVGACRYVQGLPMTEARGAFHVLGELVEIQHKTPPIMREDMVRIDGGKTADIRYRGEFADWSVRLEVEFNPQVIGAEQIANLMNLAGFHVGVGEMRPGKCGMGFGRFHVE